MPVILASEHYDRWLDPAIEQPVALQPLFTPFPSEALEAYPVSPHVNSPGRDDPDCIQSLSD